MERTAKQTVADLGLSRSCVVHIFERNEERVIYQGVNKRMPEDLSSFVSSQKVKSHKVVGSIHVIVLECGKTKAALRKDAEASRVAGKRAMSKLALQMGLVSAMLGGAGPYGGKY